MANFGVICSVADEMRELGKLINGAPLKTPLTRAEQTMPVIPLMITDGLGIYDYLSRLNLDPRQTADICKIMRSSKDKIAKALRSMRLEMVLPNCKATIYRRDIPNANSLLVTQWHVDNNDRIFVAGGGLANLQIFDDPSIPTEDGSGRIDDAINEAVTVVMQEGRGSVIDVAEGDVMFFDRYTIHRRGPFLKKEGIRTTISSGVWPITRDQG